MMIQTTTNNDEESQDLYLIYIRESLEIVSRILSSTLRQICRLRH